jgi:cadmium resistance transport/sequestration family protein
MVLAVEHLLTRIGAAIGVFVGTNVDDLVVLTVLFLGCRASGQPKAWQIWSGQYFGIAALVLLSGVAALGLSIVPERWVGLLGLIPFSLGVWGVRKAVRSRQDDDGDGRTASIATGVIAVTGVTVANGADNVSVYTPILRTVGLTESLVTVAVFAVMVAVWCMAGSWLGSHERVIAIVGQYGHWIVPAVFISIGLFILLESGVVGRLLDAT